MRTTVLRVPVGAGEDDIVEIEVDPRDLGESIRLVSGPTLDAGTAPFTMASAIDRVVPAVSTILAGLRRAADTPHEIGMELGLRIGGETGLIFAKGTAEATFTVRLTWHHACSHHTGSFQAPASRAPAEEPGLG